MADTESKAESKSIGGRSNALSLPKSTGGDTNAAQSLPKSIGGQSNPDRSIGWQLNRLQPLTNSNDGEPDIFEAELNPLQTELNPLDPWLWLDQDPTTIRRSKHSEGGGPDAFKINMVSFSASRNEETKRKAITTHPQMHFGEHKRRRSSLLGNLQAEGRLSRGLSLHHLTLHLTPEDRPGEENVPNLPPDDYYMVEDIDRQDIVLEKPEMYLKVESSSDDPPSVSQQDAPSESQHDTSSSSYSIIYPIERNTIEQQSKLNVIRNLRAYQDHNQEHPAKCYYGEDDVDLSFLTAKPVSFLIMGKPGVGKTTLGIKLAEKMHAVHLNPENVIEYFHRTTKEPLSSIRVNELLDSGESINDGTVVELLHKRVKEFDILHRGYVLEGFPLVTSDDLPVIDQIRALSTLAIIPEYFIIMQMQDRDLFQRRCNQKFDPGTGRVFTKQQYTKCDPDEVQLNRKTLFNPGHSIFHHHYQHLGGGRVFGGDDIPDNPITEEASDTEKQTVSGAGGNIRFTRFSAAIRHPELSEVDFPKLPPEILERLFYRTEDFSVIINDDLDSYRFSFPDLQAHVQNLDKRKVLEVDAYWSPSIIFKRVWEYCEAVGLQPVPIPVQIMKSMSMNFQKNQEVHLDDDDDEGSGESDEESEDDESDDDELEKEDEQTEETEETEDICEDEPPPEIDWEAAMRAVCVRDLVDPRFRWRISRWGNICPVALKLGRTIPGKPEFAVTFMDKVFFLSSKQAADNFLISPRPYLLPKMPTSPLKFIILGHPLAGKTTFAKELATMTDSLVIDVTVEIAKRFPAVKRDYMWKKRLKHTLEATQIVNKENALRWQRQERIRRRDMHAWIENHLKEVAEEEIQAALDRDHDMLRKIRQELRTQSEFHALGESYAGDGYCQSDDAIVKFDWKRFVGEAFGGKREWAHQELLQLAWDLFHQRRLYYKRRKRPSVNLTMFDDFTDEESEEEFGLVSPPEEEDEEEEASDQDSVISKPVTRKKRKKKKKRCVVRVVEVAPVVSEEILEPFLFETFDVDPDDPEVEESVRLRFPMIPFELVDIVPSPPLVGELDPVVGMILDEKMEKESLIVDAIPPELFVEIIKQAVRDAEVVYRKKGTHGAITGGWIVDNFPPEIEKWRAVLRTPKICPDQVFLLLDLSEGNLTVWNRFKKLYKLLHPPQPPEETTKHDSQARFDSIPGEDGYELEQLRGVSKNVRNSLRGEDEEIGELDIDDQPQPKRRKGSKARKTEFQIDEPSLSVVSKSHFILSLLPQNDLFDCVSMTVSEQEMIARDRNRHQTALFSAADSSDDLKVMEETLLGYEKYVMDLIEDDDPDQKEEEEEEGEDSGSDDLDEVQIKNQEAELKLKPIYGEMIACHSELKEKERPPKLSPYQRQSLNNPPGTPADEGDLEMEEGQEAQKKWSVVVPEEIQTGDISLTEEEIRIKQSLEQEIENLRLSVGEAQGYVKTPSSAGSGLSLKRNSSASIFGGELDILYEKLRNSKIDSPRRKFFAQIRTFNEFWNMALPVCNQQGVKFWDVGLCDEESALEKGIIFWNELESRFDIKAKKILETELREEDEEIMASLMKWGEPYEITDIRYRSPGKDPNDEDDDASQKSEHDSGLDDEGTDTSGGTEDEGETSVRDNRRNRERDELAGLENKPDEYWKAYGRRQAERCFGDVKYYCPVTFTDYNLLRKGYSKYACKYRDRLYYCASEECQERFLANPKQFLPVGGPPNPPPPRICITGSPGCLQEEIASNLSSEFKICYVNFRQKLHEIMKARHGRDIGPAQTGFIVPKNQSEGIIEFSQPNDDLYSSMQYIRKSSQELNMESDEAPPTPVAEPTNFRFPSISSTGKIMMIPHQEISDSAEQHAIQETTMKSLGLIGEYVVDTIPMTSIERTEELTERLWQKLSWAEAHIQAFIENGIQLPDDVLDHFILPLWTEHPFTTVGFILVGFPNSHEDVQYMLRRNLIPEQVFVMECKPIVVRNRLIIPAVDRWHKEKKAKEKPKKQARKGKKKEAEETWTYNDALSRDISRALKYYHNIYTRGLEKMKKSLNRDRIEWTPVNTNTGLHQGKHKVLDDCTAILKYRDNVFEDTVRLSFTAATALLDRGVFSLSSLHRWCPVEVSTGNKGINVWNAPTKKIPYLHRRFIYFVSGEKSTKPFEENTWELVNQTLPLQSVPLVCLVLGKFKTGKTTLARALADKYGLLYASCFEAVQSVLQHTFMSEWGPVLREENPALVATGHQPMRLADEILEYIRQGRSVPRYLVYRCLDLYLMNPKYQCNGVVFDDFPTIIDELIELNYREMTPSIVIKLKLPITDVVMRVDALRPPELKQDILPEESQDCIDYLWESYKDATKETLEWFRLEYQNIHKVDSSQSPAMVLDQVSAICVEGQRKIQHYISNQYHGMPNTLEGTCPITTKLFRRLNPQYGFLCPVALNDDDELVSVREIMDLSQVVEYKGKIYLFQSKQAVKKFMANPKRYIGKQAAKPPKDIPQKMELSEDDWARMHEHYGFMDFDPVLYHANHHYKGLQRGDIKYCVVYRRKLYLFINEENQRKFMRKPTQYWNMLLPVNVPRKPEPVNFDEITPFAYLSSKGMISVLKKVVKLLGEKRPRAPFMSTDHCAALYMGYYLKTLNMNAPYERRQKYRNAMFRFSSMKNSSKEFLTELEDYYGCRPHNLPNRLKKKLDEFLNLEKLPVEQKVFIPTMPGKSLGYERLPAPFTDRQVSKKVRNMMGEMKEVDLQQNLEAFSLYSKKKKAAEDATARAAQDAREAADLAKQVLERSQIRMLRAKSGKQSMKDTNRNSGAMDI